MTRHALRPVFFPALLCALIPVVASAQAPASGEPAHLSSFQRVARGQLSALMNDPGLQHTLDVSGSTPPSGSSRPVSAAHNVNGSWDELARTIVLGKNVTVTRMNLAVVSGKILGITAHSVTMQGPDAPRTVAREDVFRVRYAGARKKHVLWSMAIGAVAGAAWLTIADARSSNPGPESGADIGAVLGLGLGAVVGAALPIGPPLYEAEQVVR